MQRLKNKGGLLKDKTDRKGRRGEFFKKEKKDEIGREEKQ